MFKQSPTPTKDHPKAQSTLREATKALLNYIEADCHASIDRSNRFEALVDDLKEALE